MPCLDQIETRTRADGRVIQVIVREPWHCYCLEVRPPREHGSTSLGPIVHEEKRCCVCGDETVLCSTCAMAYL